ncbi:MAG: hypothetical protein ACKVP0_17980 [Pirellulaceae bacterium]
MKFTIRDLFLVTVIVALALALGWWLDRSRLVARFRPYEIQRELDEYFRVPPPQNDAPAPNKPKK